MELNDVSKPNWEKIREDWETSKITYKALSEKYNVKIGTLKSRRSREQWNRNKDATVKKDATQKSKKVATPKKNKTSINSKKKRSGNPNPKNQFTKRNQAARKHGLYGKYFSESQREIMKDFEDLDIIGQLWLQIEIKFSAIVQLQRVMWVEYSDDHLKEESGYSSGSEGSSTSYKVSFAFEQFESYVRAQARAMAEYRNLVKQFLNLAHEDDERVLKLQQMQTSITKTEKETAFIEERTKLIKGTKKDTSILEALLDVVKDNE